MSKKFTPNIPDSSHPFQNVTFVKGDTGNPAQFCMPSSTILAVPTDSAGNNGVFTNAISYIRILSAGKVIANESTLNGWAISAVSITGGTASNTGLTFTLVTITADTGYADLTISKSGESDLFIRIHFFKSKAGATGATGSQGTQGIQGVAGPQGTAGNDGDGIIVIKKTIKLKSPLRSVAITQGPGGVINCQTVSAHDVVEGEYLFIASSSFGGSQTGLVTSIVDANNFLMDITWISDDASATFFSYWHLRSDNNSNVQSVRFVDLVPERYKILSINFYCTAFNYPTPAGVRLYCGSAWYPISGYYDYMTQYLIEAVDEQNRVDLSSGFFTLDMNPNKTSFYISASVYPSWTEWDSFTGLEFDFMVVCEKLD